jgi:hypothetical protein
MRLTLILLTSFAISTMALGQPTVGSATFNKRNVAAVVFTMPYPEDAVTTGFENRMQAFGKSKKMKSYLLYQAVQVPEISTQTMNVYLKAERTSRKDEQSVLRFLIADEFDRFFTSQENPEIFANAMQFAGSFEALAAAANLELQILEQEDEVKKAGKKLNAILSDKEDYERQKQKIEEKIADAQKDIEEQEKELTGQKDKLGALITQRKN